MIKWKLHSDVFFRHRGGYSLKELWFNLVLLKFEHRCGLSKSTGSASPGENTCEMDLNDDDTFRDVSEDSYNTDCVIENKICKGNDGSSILNNKKRGYSIRGCDESDFSSSVCGESENHSKMEHFGIITSTNDSDFTQIDSDTEGGSTQIESTTEENFTQIDSDTEENFTQIERTTEENSTQIERTTEENSTQKESTTEENSTQKESTTEENSTQKESTTEENSTPSYAHLWVLCEECYTLNYKRFLKERLYICEGCESHLIMNSSGRIELLIDPNTWDPMNEKIASMDPIEWDSEEPPIELHSEEPPIELHSEGVPIELHSEGVPIELDSEELPIELDSEEPPIELDFEDDPYKDRIDSYQKNTGLTEAIQTGIGQINGIPVAMGVMEFEFMGGSMGSVVGEKITRLIEYATNQSLPLIIVCASGGARMQEGSLSLMQMAKISSALYHFQTNQKLFYVSILTSPTTGGVTASFGMLGDIIVAEPNAYIAFAGKRVIEQTLNKEVPEGSQETENLFDKGLFDLVVPRNTLKSVLNELFQAHGFFPLNQNSIE
nr:acetyl-CoA carboxylase carboxyltransferase beta subunit [Morina chlorantha]